MSRNALATRRRNGVLVVDDEQAVREVLDTVLCRAGFAVWAAANGNAALETYRTYGAAIDAVLLNVRMPDPDGPATLTALRAINPQVRCCFVSGDFGGHTVKQLRDLGAAAVLPKPFELAVVVQLVRDLIRLSAPAEPGTLAHQVEPSVSHVELPPRGALSAEWCRNNIERM